MMLQPLKNVMENVLELLCVFPHFIVHGSRNVGVVSNHPAVLQVTTLESLTEHNRNYLPSSIVLGVSEIFVFVKRWQHILMVNQIQINFVRL